MITNRIMGVAKTVKLILNLPTSHDDLPPPSAPFQSLQIDFTHMPIRYMLVIMDQFPKWAEVFPCAKRGCRVVKIAIEIIPRYGIQRQNAFYFKSYTTIMKIHT